MTQREGLRGGEGLRALFCVLQVSFANTQFEYTCIHTMIKFYKWLFQVAEEENKKDEVSTNRTGRYLGCAV